MLAVRTKKFVPKSAVAEADPRFQKVKSKVGQKATQLKKHPKAKLKAEQAQKAAKPPANEKKAGAQDKQVDAMKEAKAEEVKKDSFLELLRAEIKKVMPSTLDDADNFMEGGKEGEMKGAVSGKVGEQKGEAESQIKSKTKETPNTAGVEGKKVEEMPADPAVPVPTVNAAEGMPVPRTNEEISQKQSKVDADQQLKDNQITTTQLEKAKEPRFTEVLTAKKEVETIADASPAKYKAGEKSVLGQAISIAQSDSKRGLFGLANVKTKSGSAVKSRQLAAKVKDELARKQVADNIEAMYETTKRLVEAKLNLLEISVTSMFDNGASRAIAKMKSDTERGIKKFKKERYSGIRGKYRWFKDLFKPTPEGIKKIIKENLDVFIATMDALVVRIADTVEMRLKEAKDEIDKGQGRIKSYVSTLKGSLKEVGKAAEKEVSGRFDEMRSSVDDRKNALAQKLAQRYKEATDKANALASEIESANEGAAYKLAKKIAEIAKLILDFKDKLVSILKKAVSVILDILSDPIGFFGNLIDAVGKGFSQFKDNFAKNFKEAVAGWLFGALGGVGFELPKDLSPGSIVKLVMGIAGLTYERLRAKAVKLLGERAVGVLEKVYEYVKLLITGSPDELWAKVKEDLGSMEEIVIGGIKSWLMTSLVEAGIQKLLTMVIPGAGFVQAAIAIYKLIVFLIQRAAQIAAFISSVVDSVSDMVKGNISAAANRIEKALIQAMSLIIDLLARLLGLGGIADTIKKLVKKVQDMVDKAIDKVLDKIVQTVKKLFGKGDGKPDKRTDAEKKNDLTKAVAEAKALEKADKKPSALAKALEKIKKKYRLTDLSAKPSEKGFNVHAAVNPEITFQLDAEDGGRLTETFGKKAAAHVAALKSGTKLDAVKLVLEKTLSETVAEMKVNPKGKNLSYQSEKSANNMPIETVFLHDGGTKKKIGGLWSESQLYKETNNPVRSDKAKTFVNVVTKNLFVHDARRQYVQRYLIRNLSDADLKSMRAKTGSIGRVKGPILQTGPKHKVTQQEHVIGAKPSPFISATKTPEGQDITNPRGETFNSGDRARVDLCYISSKNIFDLSTKVGQDEWGLSNPVGGAAVQAEKDVIRTQEVLIKENIPADALEKI